MHSAEAYVLIQRLHSVLLGREHLDSPHMCVPAVLVVGHDCQLQAIRLEESPAWSTRCLTLTMWCGALQSEACVAVGLQKHAMHDAEREVLRLAPCIYMQPPASS